MLSWLCTCTAAKQASFVIDVLVASSSLVEHLTARTHSIERPTTQLNSLSPSLVTHTVSHTMSFLQGCADATVFANTQHALRDRQERVFTSDVALDMEILQSFRQHFPRVSLRKLNSKSVKKAGVWEDMLEQYGPRIPDPTLGTVLRLDADGDFCKHNIVLVLRLIWLAIEIARHVEGGGVCVASV